MEHEKMNINVELDGVMVRYFTDIKAKTGLNTANTMRYCVYEMWKREVEGVSDDR